LAPRLLAGFGSDRSRYGDAASMQKYVGVAPVKEKSGSQLYTHWRWRSPVFLRQTFIEWAGQTVIWSSWAAHYYERMKAKKKKHHVILRALGLQVDPNLVEMLADASALLRGDLPPLPEKTQESQPSIRQNSVKKFLKKILRRQPQVLATFWQPFRLRGTGASTFLSRQGRAVRPGD
jgi:hypothetical protein